MAGCGVNGFLTGRPDGFPWRCCISMKGKPEYGLVVPEEQSALPVFDTTVRSRSIYAFLKGVSLDIENYCTIRASPACQRRCLRFLSAL